MTESLSCEECGSQDETVKNRVFIYLCRWCCEQYRMDAYGGERANTGTE